MQYFLLGWELVRHHGWVTYLYLSPPWQSNFDFDRLINAFENSLILGHVIATSTIQVPASSFFFYWVLSGIEHTLFLIMLLCDIGSMPIFVATILLYVPELLAVVALWHIMEPTIFFYVALPFAYIAWKIFICFVLKEIPRTFSSSGSFSLIFLFSIFFVLGLKFKLWLEGIFKCIFFMPIQSLLICFKRAHKFCLW